MAYEYTPSIATDANGNETTDYENGSFQQRNQFHRGLAPQGFEIDAETGEHSVYELEEDGDNPDALMDDYLASVKELHPEFPDALVFAQSNLDAELLSHFYEAIDDADFDSFYEILDIILAEFDEHLEQTSSLDVEEEETNEEEVAEDEELEVPDLSSLYDATPDYDEMDVLTELADKAEGASQLIYQLAARFHSGTESADELIEKALASGFSRNELITAYNAITQ